ncbi:hypothetical protein IAI10_14275 [Clostridium sp. 19966]|uniref:hypothetical protein n=1 Tax=Clostridium sp. 19966 TaxID=2768166 RepID=UPI0028DEFC94|nr:hypothetical protein [Clostridium sp. 19966]MDT8717831.1 hypothetical protein [Clostridium sp. 19966]
MKYIFKNSDGGFGFKEDSINEILATDVKISDELYNKFFEMQNQGKQYNLKDINALTFEDAFEEYSVLVTPIQPSQTELMQQTIDSQVQQIKTLQDTVDQLVLASL